MNFFTVTTIEQAITIDKLKNCGCEVIQISSGLVIKTSKNLSEIQKEVENGTVLEVNRNDPDLSQDTKVFMGIEN